MRAKKAYGQNFLKSKRAVLSILNAANVTEHDTVLEIGPGKGVLTKELLETGAKVIAVEKDSDLIPLLTETFSAYIQNGQLTLIEEDILSFDLSKYPLAKDEYKLIANIPYYITGQIFRLFLSSDIYPHSMTMMIQKEVADRIIARDKRESILSVSVKAFGVPHYIEKVPARYFTPQPKIDSAIIHVDSISKDLFTTVTEDTFFTVMKTGFSHKRKMLANNLHTHYSKEAIGTALSQCSIDKKTRAENLSVSDWLCLSQSLNK